jgi:hypothetical protein
MGVPARLGKRAGLHVVSWVAAAAAVTALAGQARRRRLSRPGPPRRLLSTAMPATRGCYRMPAAPRVSPTRR